MTVSLHPGSKAGMRGASAGVDALPLGGAAKRRRGGPGRRTIARGILLLSFLALCTLALRHARTARIWRRALHWYLRMLHVRPLVVRATSAGLIFAVADIVAQRLSSRARVDAARLARYAVYGALVVAPFLFVWYAAMNAYAPRDDAVSSLAKCLFEQLTLEPFCIVLYIAYDALLCRRGWRAVSRRTRAAFVPLWFKNAVFWIPANFCNYYIATPDLRVVFANLCSLFWNAYFSAKINVPVPSNNPVRRASGAPSPAKFAPLDTPDA